MLFSHPGRIAGRYNRWNLTLWRSADSGATWSAVQRVEPTANATKLAQLHTAYSSLVQLQDPAATGLAYERGPMPGSHSTPSMCGEYATIRWKTYSW